MIHAAIRYTTQRLSSTCNNNIHVLIPPSWHVYSEKSLETLGYETFSRNYNIKVNGNWEYESRAAQPKYVDRELNSERRHTERNMRVSHTCENQVHGPGIIQLFWEKRWSARLGTQEGTGLSLREIGYTVSISGLFAHCSPFRFSLRWDRKRMWLQESKKTV